MKMKKILAAIAACAMSAAMLSMTAFAAGTESEEDTLDETPAESEEITEEETEEEEATEEETPAEEEEEEETPVQDNPGTGNSPIALAVIPVALAAAAVVAKKAK